MQNHLERLDPGISKRPSRFDRKYFFPNPDLAQRVQYAQYWRKRLSENKDVEFPQRLCDAIARITDGFSFAYMQEAFVAALLVIAGMDDDKEGESGSDGNGDGDEVVEALMRKDEDEDLERYVLWRQIKKQVGILRKELEQEQEE